VKKSQKNFLEMPHHQEIWMAKLVHVVTNGKLETTNQTKLETI
jgi:hypothetical protein